MMKRILIVAALAALMVAPASAQMGGGRHHGRDQQKSEQKKPQIDEKAYKAALERIPDPKTKYDPWGMTRSSTSDKK
jgi:hypothetical protein